MWRTGEFIRSYCKCVRNSGSACIAVGLLEPRETAPKPASRRVRWVIVRSLLHCFAPRKKWGGSCSRRADRNCVTDWTRMFRKSCSSLTTIPDVPLPRLFTRSCTQRSFGSMRVWKLTHSLPPIEGPHCAYRSSETVSRWRDEHQLLVRSCQLVGFALSAI